jgi:hypothetical protein
MVCMYEAVAADRAYPRTVSLYVEVTVRLTSAVSSFMCTLQQQQQQQQTDKRHGARHFFRTVT